MIVILFVELDSVNVVEQTEEMGLEYKRGCFTVDDDLMLCLYLVGYLSAHDEKAIKAL